MIKDIRLTPGGALIVEDAVGAGTALAPDVAEQLQEAFDRSAAEGLLYLGSQGLELQLPAPFLFWRELARRFFQDLCHLGAAPLAEWERVEPPAEEELHATVLSAPPMRGLEYLSAELLRRLWGELRVLVVEQARRHPDGPESYLRSVNPLWHLLGRVTFHLAENKRDPRRPFAFLATYTHRLTAGAKLQHLPLGQALKEYAGAKNQSRLNALLEPVRRAADECELVRKLLDSKALFQPQAWTIAQAYRFLTSVPRMEQAGLVVRVPDWWSARRPPRPQVQVRVGQKMPGETLADRLLDFSVDMVLDGEPLTADEKRQILEATDGLVLLRGRWVEANRDQLAQALQHWKTLADSQPDGLSFIRGMRLLAGASLGDDAAVDEQTAPWSQVVAGEWFRAALHAMRDPTGIEGCQPGRDLRATLRPYQADGVRWLWFMTRLGLGACLADDMGLGKTIQFIDLLLQMRREQPAGRRPSLLIVPASLIGNWRQELARFGPSLRVFYVHRSETDEEQLSRVAKDAQGLLSDFDLVITTYGLVRRAAWLSEVPWGLVVLDEAQAIKSPSAAQTRAVKRLQGIGRIILTGTPIENHLGDLWSLFDFCCPGLLGSATEFKQYAKRLEKRQDAQAYAALRRLVQPYILRRLKTDPQIVPDLPEKTELRADCGLSKKQAVLYERVVRDMAERLKDADQMARRGLILATLMQLKQICNHPAQYLNQTQFPAADSGKFQRLTQVCEPILERQEKVLIFTQFQKLTEPLAEFLAAQFGRPGLVLHGGTPVRRRTELVREFQNDRGPPFFVISLKAGGSGLNLTAASHVVHFDRWWNPAVENQATDRAFRIGQHRNVLVHKFVCRGTLEERIDRMLGEKQQLADQLLGEPGETALTELSDEELLRVVSLDLQRALADE